MVSSPILLDFQSSTPCLKEVVEEMSSYWSENFANPSSKGNLSGLYASASLEVSRKNIQENLAEANYMKIGNFYRSHLNLKISRRLRYFFHNQKINSLI